MALRPPLHLQIPGKDSHARRGNSGYELVPLGVVLNGVAVHKLHPDGIFDCQGIGIQDGYFPVDHMDDIQLVGFRDVSDIVGVAQGQDLGTGHFLHGVRSYVMM